MSSFNDFIGYKKEKKKQNDNDWRSQYDGDEKQIRGVIYKWDPQYKIYKIDRYI